MLRLELACPIFVLLLSAFAAPGSDAQQTYQNRTARAAVQCVRKIDACRCETASGGKIDLSPLAKTGGQFAFSDRTGPSGGFNYYYNPCNGVTCDGSTDAATCQRTKNTIPATEYLLGTQSSAKFETDPTLGLVLKYTGLSGDKALRETQLQLICDTSGSGASLFTPLDDGKLGTVPIPYKMSLLSVYCCEISGPITPDGGGGLSGGDILLIAFFSLAFVYIAVGLAVNLAVRKRSGREAVPNLNFWASLPSLVRDGTVFTFGAVKAVVTRRKGEYQSV